jgi:hypothetical protein
MNTSLRALLSSVLSLALVGQSMAQSTLPVVQPNPNDLIQVIPHGQPSSQNHYATVESIQNGAINAPTAIGIVNTAAPRVHVAAWAPEGSRATQTAGTYSNASGGGTGIFTVEVPDDFDAVQLGVENTQGAGAAHATWQVDTAAATASSSYGNPTTIGGKTYDQNGTQITNLVPFQWGNNGVNSAPWVGLPGQASGQPGPVVALTVTTASANPATTLTFSGGVTPGRLLGANAEIQTGWYVADGLGCIAPGATVNVVGTTTISLTGNSGGALACGQNQAIWFSPVPFQTFTSPVVPAQAANGPPQAIYSDWLELSSLYRVDGGFTTGNVMSVSGTNIAAGTTLLNTTPNSLVLSQPIAGTVGAQAAITLTVQTTATVAVTNDWAIPVASTAGIHKGQTVSGTGIVSGSLVQDVDTVNNIVTVGSAGGLTTPVLTPGAVLTFTNVIYTNASTSSGSSLPVVSTSRNRLLQVRFFLDSANTSSSVTLSPSGCTQIGACQQALGIPPVWSAISGGGGANSKDSINYLPSQSGTTAETKMPAFFLRFATRHRSVTTLQCGGFNAQGADTVDTGASAALIAANALSTPEIPVFALNASGSSNTNTNFTRCSQWIEATNPGIVVFQTYSDHGPDSLQSYLTNVETLAAKVRGYGGQPVLMIDAPEQSLQINGLVVTTAVNNSTSVPIPYVAQSVPFGGSGYLITGAGIPAGTTGTFSSTLPWTLTLSQAATIAAGTPIFVGYQNSTATSSSTSLTLAYPAAFTVSGEPVSGPGIPANTTISITLNSTSATLSNASSVPANAMLTISHNDLSSGVISSLNRPMILALGKNPATSLIWDTRGAGWATPTSPTYGCSGCSFDGIYNSDYGEYLWSQSLAAVLAPLVSQ